MTFRAASAAGGDHSVPSESPDHEIARPKPWARASHAGSTTRYLDAITGGFVDINNPDMLSSWRPGLGAGVTRGNLLLHELGHATGLKHVSNRHLLMYPTMTSASPNGYAAGDRAGLAFVGKRPGCVTVR